MCALNTAIIFGAGASIPHLLSQNGLVRELLAADESDRIRPAQLYLRYSFPGLNNDSIVFEDIVGPLEIAESEEYWYHFGGKDPRKDGLLVTNQEVLDALDTWVALALDPKTLPRPIGKKQQKKAAATQYETFYAPSQSSSLAYSRLISTLEGLEGLTETAFLSMNYDILLDRSILTSPLFFPDYRIDAFYDYSAALERQRKTMRALTVLKLHGSLNWRVCTRCHVLRDLGPFVVWPNSNCADCGGRTARPMLIRPTLLKDFRHRVWKDVWKEAGHVLADARHWIFIGYSLPLADVWMLRLLIQSARSGSIGLESRRITVVNPDLNVARRFRLLFPSLEFKQQTFEAWLDDSNRNRTLG